MARCGDCNKFVGLEMQDPEVNNVDVGESITAEVRIVRVCAECGTEMKEATLELEADLPDSWEDHLGKVREALKADGKTDDEIQDAVDEHTVGGEEGDVEATERQDGKPGTPSRFRKSFFGATLTVKLACGADGCGWEDTIELSDDIQASAMEELS